MSDNTGFDAAKVAFDVVDELASRNLIGCRLDSERKWAKVEAAFEAALLRAVEAGEQRAYAKLDGVLSEAWKGRDPLQAVVAVGAAIDAGHRTPTEPTK